MLNIFSLKKLTKVESSVKSGSGKRASAAQLRITKDLNELELPRTCRTEFPGKIQGVHQVVQAKYMGSTQPHTFF